MYPRLSTRDDDRIGKALNTVRLRPRGAYSTTNEFVNVFTKNGIWAKLIQVDAEQLEEHCQTAYWMNWIVCGALFVLQCGVACRSSGPITTYIVLPICTLAVVYLLLPPALVHASLIQRENRLQISAVANALQVSSDNLLPWDLPSSDSGCGR